jgi:peptidoglycan/LPS O-acetylase OafA/YrhL
LYKRPNIGKLTLDRPLRLLRSRQFEQLQTTLTSSVFRRAFRLFVPTTLSTFTVMLFVYWGVIGEKKDNFYDQFWDWTTAVWVIGNAWFWDTMQRPAYDVHLWTIPIEMSHSMLLFLTVLGLSRSRVQVRIGMTFAIIWYCCRMGRWAACEFLYGMFLAEFSLIQDSHASLASRKAYSEGSDSVLPMTPTSKTRSFGLKFVLSNIFWLSNFFCGIWIGGWPNWGVDDTPGFRYLVSITPYPFWQEDDQYLSYFWYAIAAAQIVTACQQLNILRRIFNSPVAQYLGNISYALYLVHGLVEDVLRAKWVPHLQSFTGTETFWQRQIFWMLSIATFTPWVIWAADLFWRYVDVNVVITARKLEELCSINNEERPEHPSQ